MKYATRMNDDGALEIYDMLDYSTILTFSNITDERNIALFSAAPKMFVMLNELIGMTDEYTKKELQILDLLNKINKGEY